jgi:hypothetical protein
MVNRRKIEQDAGESSWIAQEDELLKCDHNEASSKRKTENSLQEKDQH